MHCQYTISGTCIQAASLELLVNRRKTMNPSGVGSQSLTALFQRFRLQRGLLFGVLIITALLAFEVFNYSTTDYALADLLGDLSFLGIHWSTILALAFCGIDFAGIARLFTPEEGADEPAETWYLFGAWMLAATMNAMLTWWGVSLAILGHETLGNAVIERQTLLRVVPIFVAIMVWLIRVLIIGTFSIAGERLFSQAHQRPGVAPAIAANPRPAGLRNMNHPRTSTPISAPASRPAPTASPSPAFRPTRTSHTQEAGQTRQPAEPTYTRPEPTYHPASMNPNDNNRNQTRR
jgi:hypothetical protein